MLSNIMLQRPVSWTIMRINGRCKLARVKSSVLYCTLDTNISLFFLLELQQDLTMDDDTGESSNHSNASNLGNPTEGSWEDKPTGPTDPVEPGDSLVKTGQPAVEPVESPEPPESVDHGEEMDQGLENVRHKFYNSKDFIRAHLQCAITISDCDINNKWHGCHIDWKTWKIGKL